MNTMSTANISAKDVMALRQKTGLGMMDCKKALVEANGDIATAETHLRAKLKGKMDERTDRAAGEGCIAVKYEGDKAAILEVRAETDFTARNEMFVAMANDVAGLSLVQPAGAISFDEKMTEMLDNVRITTNENVSFARGERVDGAGFGRYVHHDGKLGVLVEIVCESDFVAMNEDFKKFCHGVAMTVAAFNPKYLDKSAVPAEDIEKEQNIVTEMTKQSMAGKPDNVIEKAVTGRMEKWFGEHTLMAKPYVPDDSKSVEQVRTDLVAKIGENIQVRRYFRMELGG